MGSLGMVVFLVACCPVHDHGVLVPLGLIGLKGSCMWGSLQLGAPYLRSPSGALDPHVCGFMLRPS